MGVTSRSSVLGWVTLLLGLFGGCKATPTPDLDTHGAPAASPVSEVSERVAAPAPSSSPAASMLDTTELVRARAACLRSPLSPSAQELPALAGHRHEVHGENQELHVFYPLQAGHFSTALYETKLAKLRQHLPQQANTSIRRCGPKPASRSPHDRFCVHLEVPLCTPWLQDAERLLPWLAPEGLGLSISLMGRPGPRCSGADCQPLKYHDDSTTRADLVWSGWFTLPFHPDEPRVTLLPELGAGTCNADGDCVRAGCGNHCEAWQEEPHGANCPAYTALDDAYCGCVDNRCSWFTQTPHVSVQAQVQVRGWVTPSHEDGRDLDSGEVVFEQLFEGPWFRRQLERALTQDAATRGGATTGAKSLPTRVDFTLSLDPRFRISKPRLSADGATAPAWLTEIFVHLPVPVPTFRPNRPLPKVEVTGQLVVTSK
jgi:hypothetical protein